MRADELFRKAYEDARNKEATAASVAAALAAAGPAVNPIPWYFRAVPAIEIGVTQGSIVICSPDLDYNTAITFRGASGLLCVTNADYPVDLYKYAMKMSMRMAEVTLIPNKHRIFKVLSHDKQRNSSSSTVEGGAGVDVGGVERLADDAAREHEDTAGWTESNKFIYGNCWDAKKGEYICSSVECHVLQSPFMKIVYSQDQGFSFNFVFMFFFFFLHLKRWSYLEQVFLWARARSRLFDACSRQELYCQLRRLDKLSKSHSAVSVHS
jgi:hypothetical protein